MSLEKVKEYFEPFGISGRIREFNVSSATVELAAQALNCAPERIAKTLAFAQKNHEAFILIVTAGDMKIDNAKYKAVFGEKAAMLPPGEAEDIIGHAVGGICPFGINDGLVVYLDVSLQRFTTVFPACGSSNSTIELSIDELEKYSGFRAWVDVCQVRPAAS